MTFNPLVPSSNLARLTRKQRGQRTLARIVSFALRHVLRIKL